ncbi:Lipopolysaccharide core heptosyltransferase RfaQ [Achromobacter veterisilvae]|uniref:Lipopolysaccharide core heptosyltransferase RfaQ n=1 Tax=Achromobacter veterisilvae TaxID=2069367 RepID=A0A446CGV2_9BURK|nr:glycosyltransferase family 9 protein [Achromobacter veterisilvae]SSW67126.1 Lipopolysaccharide core heptosyltransferase RfaQ [Achromobacter veterisilvae]
MAWDWRECSHVLCVRLDNMGDVLMCSPAFRALKQSGARRLSLLTSESGGRLAPYVPEVDTVLAYDAAWIKNGARGSEQDVGAIARLRALRPDAAVIFTAYSQSALPAALLCHLAGVPRVLAHSRENPYRLITEWVRETEPQAGIRHEVRRQLDLVASVGARCEDLRLSFRVREADRISLRRKLHHEGVTERGGWICAHAGATAPSRRYPARMMMQALIGLRGDGRRILLLGGHEDPALAGALADARRLLPGLIDLSDRLTLGELGAALEAAALMICNNSGPAHVAAALGVPVVDLYALTNPQHTPWQTPARVLNRDVPCKYCYRSVCPEGHQACLAGVDPGCVAEAAHELLAQARGVQAGPRAAKEEFPCLL